MRRWLRVPLARPVVTIVLLAALVVIFVPMALSQQINDQFLLWGSIVKQIRYPDGSLHGILYGEWWRLITGTFLHAGILHIALNGYALYLIGMELKSLFGRQRFVVVYAISGLAGSVASFAFTPFNVPGVGASGAIFGLIGALGVYFGIHRRLYGRMGTAQFWNIIVVIVLNLGIGLSGIFPIDNSAHIGGLLAGAAVGFVLCPRYTLGDWYNPLVRNLVNTNKGPLMWFAAAAIGLIVILIFVVLLIMFNQGIIKPFYQLG